MLFLATAVLQACGTTAAPGRSQPQDSQSWRADHHMHLASVDLCERSGDCLESNEPPAVYAADAVHALDDSGIGRGVVFSSAYLYGLAALGLARDEVAAWTRRENEFTRDEVARYPGRLAGFLSVDPLLPGAIDEIRYWIGSKELVGLKLHFNASAVDLERKADRQRVARVIRTAANQGLPMVIHIGGGDFGAAAAESFINDMLPNAGDTWVQIAHAGGGFPLKDHNHARVLDVFARHIAAGDPLTRHVLFDLSFVPMKDEGAADIKALVAAMRRIGMERFLFGSDYNVGTPARQIESLERLLLTAEEWLSLRRNCAPWACPSAAGTRQ